MADTSTLATSVGTPTPQGPLGAQIGENIAAQQQKTASNNATSSRGSNALGGIEVADDRLGALTTNGRSVGAAIGTALNAAADSNEPRADAVGAAGVGAQVGEQLARLHPITPEQEAANQARYDTVNAWHSTFGDNQSKLQTGATSTTIPAL